MIISFHPYCWKWPYFIHFYGWIVFHLTYIENIFIHSSVGAHLGCLHVLAVVNSAAMNIGVHVTLWIIALSEYVPRSGVAGSYGNSSFSFWRNLHTVYHSGYISLHSHQQCRKILFSPYPLHHLFVNFLMMTSVRRYFTIVLISAMAF